MHFILKRDAGVFYFSKLASHCGPVENLSSIKLAPFEFL
jgi:hypothetical protein